MTIKEKSKIRLEARSKILVLGLILIVLVGLFSPVTKVSALIENCLENREILTKAECERDGNTWIPSQGYQLLSPLPCEIGTPGCGFDTNHNPVLTSFDPAQPNNLGVYLNLMIKIFIGLAAVLSIVMIVVGGIEYMTSELIHSKEAGKERITQAILGLLIALGAYALLYTINPDLLKSDLCISPQVMKGGKCTNPPSATAPSAIKPGAPTEKISYFEYYDSDETSNTISGPHDEMECGKKLGEVTQSSKVTLIRICFKSITRPNLTPSNWYFEYFDSRPELENNFVFGPYSQASCPNEENRIDKKIYTRQIRGCFQSSTTPVRTPKNPSEVRNWYFEYYDSNETGNTISGPNNKAECEKQSTGVVASGMSRVTIIKPCFQSDTRPNLTPSNWYFEYFDSRLNRNFLFGPYNEASCKNEENTIDAKIYTRKLRNCFPSDTKPTTTTLS